ncbi:phage tail spike protein [Bacillus sp. JCM 19041]|uniref:phage tail spike protein n=1 Tax=Bacillus sp. JCM 19041 TaxID=1460637 RepID=UPI0006D14C87
MNLFVFNSEEKLLAVLDERHVVEAIHTEQLNNVHSLEFTVLANSDHAFGIMEGNLVAFCDQDDNEFQLFEIAIIEDNHGDVALKTAVCEHAINELLDEYVKSAVFEKASADKVLDYLLSSTRWQKGEVSALGEASFKIESSNVKSALNELLNTWHGEVKYRVSISGNKIAGRYIDILSRRGNDTGKRFEYDKDVKEIERTVDMTGVKTAIRGYGQPKENENGDSGEPLTFKDVVWKKENGDPVDKPKGQDWVGDEHARLIWGRTDQNGKRHRYGIYEQSDEKDAEKLLQQTFEYLESTSSPLVNYAGKVIDLFRLSLYEHERVHLGDTVAVLDDDVYPKIQERTRIIEIKRDLLDPTNDEIVLGEFCHSFLIPIKNFNMS